MKKILLFILSTVIFGIFSDNITFADDNLQKVYKIESYQYEENIDTFVLKQYGSSLYINDGLIYTNAHVILDEENIPFGNYRVCKTIDFKEKAQCFSVGKLLYYDTVNDLAVLKIGTTDTNGAIFSNKEIAIGNTVKVYGYPSNGGETITYTEGKISGYEKGLYKIDANLDAGNSGGGVFDADGNLIGMAVSVSVGYSTLGYVIPINKINNFIAKKGESIENYNEILSNNFINFTTTKNKIVGTYNFKNENIDLKNTNLYDFKISDFLSNNSKLNYLLELSDKNNETNISIENATVSGKSNYNLDDFLKYNEKDAVISRNDPDIELIKVRKVNIKNKDVVLSLILSTNNRVYLNLLIEQSKNNLLNINISSSNLKNKSFLNGVKLILKNLEYLNNIDITNNTDSYMLLDNLKIDKADGFFVLKSIDGGNLLNYGDIKVETSTYKKYKTLDYGKDYSLSSGMISNYNELKDKYYIDEYLIKQTKNGENYVYMYGINNETVGSIENKEENRYFIDAFFYDKIDEEKGYLNTFIFTFNEEISKNEIDKLLDTIKTSSGKGSFPIGELKIGENIVINQK